MQTFVKVILVAFLLFICICGYVYYNDSSFSNLYLYNNSSEAVFTLSSIKSKVDSILHANNVTATMKPSGESVGVSTAAVTEKLQNISQTEPTTVTSTQPQHPITDTATVTDVHQSKLVTLAEESKGYILPFSIYEEQTNGANNLWQLQKWAKQVDSYVVEPFATDSIFSMSTIVPNFDQALRFGDYYDFETWNEMVINNGGNPLVKWEQFISKAPRKGILLYTLKDRVISSNSDQVTIVKYAEKRINHDNMLWIRQNFNITRTFGYLCSTYHNNPLTVENFTSLIFGNTGLQPKEVTVIVVNWVGIRSTRITLKPHSLFTSALEQNLILPPSQRVMKAYRTYVDQFIGNHKYVGIVFRTHHVLQFSPLTGNFSEQSKHLLQCSKTLSSVLDKVRDKWKIFLAYDMGMFGSKKYSSLKQLISLRDQIFLDVFNGSLLISEREENLRKAANGTTDRGVIAMLEKVIAANANCIVLLGTHSTFVRSSGALYVSLHHTDKCVVSICSEGVYDHRRLISSQSIPNQFIAT